MASPLAEILANYGEGYQSPATSGDSEIYDTSNVLGRMVPQNSLTKGLRGLADILQRDSVPHNVLSGGINTAANWLDWRPNIGADTLAPLGLAAFGSAPAGALAASAARRTPRTAAADQGKRDLYGLEGKPFEMAADAPIYPLTLEGAKRTFDYYQQLQQAAASGGRFARAARQQLKFMEQSGDLDFARKVISQHHSGPTQEAYWRALDAFASMDKPTRLNADAGVIPGTIVNALDQR